ncbi:MAG: hypothetical protein QW552_04060 [Ignisphaera sp.]|uniref:Uncharacterized protein n=1 Tax=Ignisphaera aggregans TaxID=334771 RepID=A0A7C4NMT5_9CREN
MDKHGKDRVQEVLEISRTTMWRLLNRKSKLNNGRLKLLLTMIAEDEFRKVLEAGKVLEAAGLVRDGMELNPARAGDIGFKPPQNPRPLGQEGGRSYIQ